MSFTNSFEEDLLEYLFEGTAIPSYGANVYIALFTSDPGEAGGGTEATFGSYARQAVAVGAGWTVSGNQAENASAVTFPEATSGSETITHFGIMKLSSGGEMIGYGALDASRLVSSGTTLEFGAGAITVTLD